MKYKILLNSLYEYSKEELIYKEYYELIQQQRSIDDFTEKYKQDTHELSCLFHPEQLDFSSSEDSFILQNHNVTILKHPRYFPLFYHEHTFFEMIYVLSGTCVQLYEDHEIILNPGDLCIMAPQIVHGIKVFDDSVIINILIRRSTFLDIFINTIRDKTYISMFFLNSIYGKNKLPYILFHTGSDKLIRNYILDMYHEQTQPDEYSDRIICSILSIFFAQLIRLHKEHIETPQIHTPQSNYETEIFNYIVNHYAHITLADVAAHFHFSVPYCSKLIKKITGSTFSEIQKNIRLQQGENYLLHTQMSISDISEKLGFKNPETFIRMFQQKHKITPSKYRLTQNFIY